jgi:hypothetical protein
MDRAEAEAIYDSGRERCVVLVLELAAMVERLTASTERLEERVRRLEAEGRRDSRTSSMPPSHDPPKTRQQRRAEARAKAKELVAERGDAQREAGGQEGHAGARRGQVLRIRSMRSSLTTRPHVVAVAESSQRMSGGPVAGSVAIRCASCRRSA